MTVLIVIAMCCFLLCQHLPSVEKALQRSVKMELLDGENLYMCPRFVIFFGEIILLLLLLLLLQLISLCKSIFVFSFVLNSLPYITLPRNNEKTKINCNICHHVLWLHTQSNSD